MLIVSTILLYYVKVWKNIIVRRRLRSFSLFYVCKLITGKDPAELNSFPSQPPEEIPRHLTFTIQQDSLTVL